MIDTTGQSGGDVAIAPQDLAHRDAGAATATRTARRVGHGVGAAAVVGVIGDHTKADHAATTATTPRYQAGPAALCTQVLRRTITTG